MFHVKHSYSTKTIVSNNNIAIFLQILLQPTRKTVVSRETSCYNKNGFLYQFYIYEMSGKGILRMGKIIAFANQKGGVGKTTTAVNLAAALAEQGKKILVCDFDPQGNATSGFGIDPRELKTSVYEVTVLDEPVEDAIVKTKWVDVLGANVNLAGAEIDLIDLERREYRLKMALDPLRDAYDYIFIDCPPSLGLLTLNSLCAADSFLVPLQCEYYALEGLTQLMMTIRSVQRALNQGIKMEGVLLTMFDGRTNLSLQVVEEVKRHFGKKVFATVVPRNVRLSEAPSHGQPITAYDRYCRGAEAYMALALEFLRRNEM